MGLHEHEAAEVDGVEFVFEVVVIGVFVSEIASEDAGVVVFDFAVEAVVVEFVKAKACGHIKAAG